MKNPLDWVSTVLTGDPRRMRIVYQIGIVEHGSDADQASTTAWHDGNILPRVLTLLALAMMFVVEPRHGRAQRLDARDGTILPGGFGDVNGFRSIEASFDAVRGLRSSLDSRMSFDQSPHLRRSQEGVPGRDWPTSPGHQQTHIHWLSRCTRRHRSTLLTDLVRHERDGLRGHCGTADGSCCCARYTTESELTPCCCCCCSHARTVETPHLQDILCRKRPLSGRDRKLSS